MNGEYLFYKADVGYNIIHRLSGCAQMVYHATNLLPGPKPRGITVIPPEIAQFAIYSPIWQLWMELHFVCSAILASIFGLSI